MAIPARIDSIDLAIWRSASGKVHAWGDRCPHRGMRLSHGFVRGETLSCIYHGWQYGSDGGCSYIPAHPKLTPPKSICARSYACEDESGLIWVALEETEDAPPALADLTPVRSLPFQVPANEVAAFFGDPASLLFHAGEVTVLLHSTSPQDCMAHVLTAGDAKEASRWIEARRLQIEGALA